MLLIQIMDEATASVDFATDEALQRAIRSEFKESTVITIAHRLSSVIDYDRLLVLADGGIREFDSPKVSGVGALIAELAAYRGVAVPEPV